MTVLPFEDVLDFVQDAWSRAAFPGGVRDPGTRRNRIVFGHDWGADSLQPYRLELRRLAWTLTTDGPFDDENEDMVRFATASAENLVPSLVRGALNRIERDIIRHRTERLQAQEEIALLPAEPRFPHAGATSTRKKAATKKKNKPRKPVTKTRPAARPKTTRKVPIR